MALNLKRWTQDLSRYPSHMKCSLWVGPKWTKQPRHAKSLLSFGRWVECAWLWFVCIDRRTCHPFRIIYIRGRTHFTKTDWRNQRESGRTPSSHFTSQCSLLPLALSLSSFAMLSLSSLEAITNSIKHPYIRNFKWRVLYLVPRAESDIQTTETKCE